jgi:transmembrane sensor
MGHIKPSERALREEAAQWAIRRLDDDSDECAAGLTAWLEQSPRHMEEYLLAQALLGEVRALDERAGTIAQLTAHRGSDILPLRAGESTAGCSGAEQDLPRGGLNRRTAGIRPSRSQIALYASAAIVAVLAVGLAGWLTLSADRTYATELGEQRTLRLADGSLVELNTDSRIAVAFSRRVRAVRVLRGEAYFTVAQDAKRPFRAFSDNAVVQAIGTQFSIYRSSDGTRVAVVEGRVQVAPNTPEASGSLTSVGAAEPHSRASANLPASAQLAAGEEANVASDGHLVKAALPDIQAAVSWRQRRLTFHNTPLATVIAEFRRYNELRIGLEGDGLAERRITGVFHTDQPESLVEFLSEDPTLTVQRTADGVRVRPRQ